MRVGVIPRLCVVRVLADLEGVTESLEVCTTTDAMRAESIFSLLTIAACVSADRVRVAPLNFTPG